MAPSLVVPGSLVDGTDELFGGEVSETLKALEGESAAFSEEIGGQFPVDGSGGGKVVQGLAGLQGDVRRGP
jgi:hypothetical protein